MAARAIGSGPRWRLPSPFRMVQVFTAAAVIVLFGGFLLLGGLLGPTEDTDPVGASPTASLEPATFPPATVTYASGALVPIDEPDGDTEGPDDEPAIDLAAQGLDVLGYGTTRYTVTSSDPRLEGIATVVDIEAYWDHETTIDDIEADDPGGPWRLEVGVARIEIVNDDGAWSGTAGPALRASGTEPIADGSGGAPGFDQVGPAILEGRGAYAGLWALMQLVNNEVPDAPEVWVPDGSQPSTYEAIVVNRRIQPADDVWNALGIR